ncbi:hypothetical protein C4573_06760 [Candidatus Woesearchaeota archaeon]|nr:MAG: hypothetical protein C4573_06760 [Candidatus Woesearchaeota archaeon]
MNFIDKVSLKRRKAITYDSFKRLAANAESVDIIPVMIETPAKLFGRQLYNDVEYAVHAIAYFPDAAVTFDKSYGAIPKNTDFHLQQDAVVEEKRNDDLLVMVTDMPNAILHPSFRCILNSPRDVSALCTA